MGSVPIFANAIAIPIHSMEQNLNRPNTSNQWRIYRQILDALGSLFFIFMPRRVCQIIISSNFPENCMKVKNVHQKCSAHPKCYYVGPPLKTPFGPMTVTMHTIDQNSIWVRQVNSTTI